MFVPEKLTAAFFALVVTIASLLGVLSLRAGLSSPSQIPTTELESNMWAGYVVEGSSPGSIVGVNGSWTVSPVNCFGNNGASVLAWIGIDGWKSGTVEQIGTRADCVAGVATYQAWSEFWPKQPDTVMIQGMDISPGDHITAFVEGEAVQREFTMRITDDTTGVSRMISAVYAEAELITAEWIVEAPIVIGGPRYSMAHFAPLTFTQMYAETDGRSSSLISLAEANGASVLKLIYVCNDNSPKAQPSQIESGRNAFTVTWLTGGGC